MYVTELDGFILKLKHLWRSGLVAHLHIETHTGQAWASLNVKLEAKTVLDVQLRNKNIFKELLYKNKLQKLLFMSKLQKLLYMNKLNHKNKLEKLFTV